MRRSVLTLFAALAVAVTGCGQTPSSPSPGIPATTGATDPPTHAKAEASRLLSLVHVPSTATAADSSPVKILDQPAQTPATNDIVTEHRWWTNASDPQTALDWLKKHGVTHLTSGGTGTSGGPSGVTEYTLVFVDHPPAGISSEEVQLDVAPMADGTSAIRADVQVVWLVSRPAAESIPGTIQRIDVSAFKMQTQIGHRALTGARARRLAKIINSLPTALRGEGGCGADFGYRLHVVAGPLVFDEDVACRDIAVTDDGKALPALNGEQRFIHAVASSMGLPDYLTD